MKRSAHRRRTMAVVTGALVIQSLVLGVSALTPAATAASLDKPSVDALDQTAGGVAGAELTGDPQAVAVLSAPMHGFPTQGKTALILSTGDASVVADPSSSKTSTKTQFGDDAGTILDTPTKSADGNDLTQVAVELNPPAGSGCVGFDFMFLSEEFPRYKGDKYNDVFTAELNTSKFALNGTQVEAPNNFALSADKEVLSINSFNKFVKAPESSLNGRSEQYSATSPLDGKGGPATLYLTVQDLGDSYIDSAVVVDNLRYLAAKDCAAGTESIVDTDGDALPDVWETNGIDLDKDGTPELDLPAMGADPRHKDIFAEIDWMKDEPACTAAKLVCGDPKRDETPHEEATKKVVAAFAAAPVENPDGKQGITLHVDAGPDSLNADGKTWGALARGNRIPFAEEVGQASNGKFSWDEFDKQHQTDEVRKDVFHRVIYGNSYPGQFKSSGYGQRPGARLTVTSHDWPWPIASEAGTFMHELGHNLGIDHGGADGTNNKPGYYSLMSYDYQFLGVDHKGKLDYSRGDTDYKLSLKDVAAKRYPQETGPDTIPPVDTHNDWKSIVYAGDGIGALGASVGTVPESDAEKLDFDNAVFTNGEAGIALLGPSLVAPGLDKQVLIADVTNHSTIEATYKVSVKNAVLEGSAPITVPADQTMRVSIPIKVNAAGEAPLPTEVRLAYKGKLMSTSTMEVNSVDLSDDDTAAEVKSDLQEVATDPPKGLDQDVVNALDKTVAPEVGVDLSSVKVSDPEEDEAASSLPVPIWVLGLIAVVVLLLLGIVVARLRKKA